MKKLESWFYITFNLFTSAPLQNEERASRKRKRRPQLRKKFLAKESVERDQERITKSGKTIPAKN